MSKSIYLAITFDQGPGLNSTKTATKNPDCYKLKSFRDLQQ